MNPFFKDFSDFIKEQFPSSGKLQKLTVDAGLTCPNRDGRIGTGGCIYCNNASFSPDLSEKETGTADRQIGDSKRTQLRADEIILTLEKGRCFFARKYPSMRYLAYFQSYTNTYGDPDRLIAMYEAALSPGYIDGLIIGTRPDCIDAVLLDRLMKVRGSKKIIFELGAETCHDHTLKEINRHHSWADTVNAVTLLKNRHFPVGLHFIFGLPGENEEDMLRTVEQINTLPVNLVKFHHLQIIKGTALWKRWLKDRNYVKPFGVDEYISLAVKVIKLLRNDIAIDRFVSSSPQHMLEAPAWKLKNHEFIHRLMRRLETDSELSLINKI